MNIPQPTAADLAFFDQAYANRSECIDGVIVAFRAAVAADGNAELHTAALAQYFINHVDQGLCADLLAVACRRLAQHTTQEAPHG